jgi:hypothetical protein
MEYRRYRSQSKHDRFQKTWPHAECDQGVSFQLRESSLRSVEREALAWIERLTGGLAEFRNGFVLFCWYPRQGSNLRPFAPEANALIH